MDQKSRSDRSEFWLNGSRPLFSRKPQPILKEQTSSYEKIVTSFQDTVSRETKKEMTQNLLFSVPHYGIVGHQKSNFTFLVRLKQGKEKSIVIFFALSYQDTK